MMDVSALEEEDVSLLPAEEVNNVFLSAPFFIVKKSPSFYARKTFVLQKWLCKGKK